MTRRLRTPFIALAVAATTTLTAGILAPLGSSPVAAAPADPDGVVAVVIEGQGNGHGRGLSQWGSYGWATTYAKDWQWILDFYYGGTANAAAPTGQRITVSLSALNGAQTAVIAAEGNGQFNGAGAYRSMVAREVSGNDGTYDVWAASNAICPAAGDSLSSWAYLGRVSAGTGQAAVRFSVPNGDDPNATVGSLLGVCEPTGPVRHYRGSIYAANGSAGEDRTVNDVDVEAYLRGVVPRESPASWGDAAGGAGINALRAQAVAARSYALAQGGSYAGRRYTFAKTCDTQSCQVYGGAGTRPSASGSVTVIEDARSDRAIVDTAGLVRERASAPGVPVSTEFSSSNGDRTAGGAFPAVDDLGDRIDANPWSRWTRVLDASGLASRFGLARITSVTVEPDPSLVSQNFSGAWSVRLRLHNGSQSVAVTASQLRTAYDLPSTAITGRAVTRDYVTSDDFVFIGDSVGQSIADRDGSGELPVLLSGVFGTAKYDALTNRCTVGNCTPGSLDGLGVAQGLTGSPDVVIVELGYNDTQTQLAGEIDQVMSALVAKGVRVVGWVGMSERRTSNGSSTYAVGNRALRAALDRWPQMRFLDWDGASIGGARDRWYSDNVHLNTTGQAEFALWLRDRAIELAGGRPGSPQWSVKVGPGSDLRLPLAGSNGIPASGAVGVSLNLTAVDPAAEGYLTVWPCGSTQPYVSNVNFVAGQIVPNAVVAALDSTGTVCVASSTASHVLVDVNGWLDGASGFNPLTPSRLFDTRDGSGGVVRARVGALDGTGTRLEVPVLGRNGVPATGVAAVSLNVTATNTRVNKFGGFVTVYPCVEPRPNVSSLNFGNSQSVPNAVIVPVSSTGTVCFHVYGEADLLADVGGWFASGSGMTPVAPTRVLDTRSALGAASNARIGKLDGTGAPLSVTMTGVGGVPTSGVAAVVLNVTAVDTKAPAAGGYVTVYPCTATPPNASNLNFVSGQTIPNAVIAPVSADGKVCFHVYGEAHLIADVNGWMSATGGFTAVSPVRVSDTRIGVGQVPGR